jgi:hypothetical protein
LPLALVPAVAVYVAVRLQLIFKEFDLAQILTDLILTNLLLNGYNFTKLQLIFKEFDLAQILTDLLLNGTDSTRAACYSFIRHLLREGAPKVSDGGIDSALYETRGL